MYVPYRSFDIISLFSTSLDKSKMSQVISFPAWKL
jgi:hypothetical protein